MDGMEQKLFGMKEKCVDLIVAGGGKILTRSKSFELSDKPVFFHVDLKGPMKLCSVIVLYNVKPPIVYQMDTVRSFPINWLEHAIQTFKIEVIKTDNSF